FLLAREHIERIGGNAFNIGGGAHNTISLTELIQLIGKLHGRTPQIKKEDWRVGDQRYYVSHTSKFSQATGWTPRIHVSDGVARLYRWLLDERTAQPTPMAA
ncbi:MAG: hypothetical protein LC737_11300, partial [Chloroflexi bacterium]|nr:hypothetical protein [Chloroflexota bacterium]